MLMTTQLGHDRDRNTAKSPDSETRVLSTIPHPTLILLFRETDPSRERAELSTGPFKFDSHLPFLPPPTPAAFPATNWLVPHLPSPTFYCQLLPGDQLPHLGKEIDTIKSLQGNVRNFLWFSNFSLCAFHLSHPPPPPILFAFKRGHYGRPKLTLHEGPLLLPCRRY